MLLYGYDMLMLPHAVDKHIVMNITSMHYDNLVYFRRPYKNFQL